MQIIHKTAGIALQNTSYGTTSGTTWGVEVGGNVMEAYVILQKEVTTVDVSNPNDALVGHIAHRLIE